MTTQDQLLAEVEAFLAWRGMAPARFGVLAVNDGGLVRRLRSGAGITLRNFERIRRFMAQERERMAAGPIMHGYAKHRDAIT